MFRSGLLLFAALLLVGLLVGVGIWSDFLLLAALLHAGLFVGIGAGFASCHERSSNGAVTQTSTRIR